MDLYAIRQALSAGKSIYDLPLRVTFYARVSTDKDAQLHSLSAQVNYYSEFIRKNKCWTFAEGYIDEGISGTSVRKRENFLRMIEDAKAQHQWDQQMAQIGCTPDQFGQAMGVLAAAAGMALGRQVG